MKLISFTAYLDLEESSNFTHFI